MWIWIAIILAATVPAYVFKKKFGIETQGPICLWKTKKTLNLIEKLSKNRVLWKSLADMGIVFAFGLIGTIFLLLDKTKNKRNNLKVAVYYTVFALSSILLTINYAQVSFPLVLAVTLLTGLGGFSLLLLGNQSFTIITKALAGQESSPGVAPVIPGVKVPGSPLAPPISAVIGLVILLIVHEWGHGIVSRAEKIAVKSVGLVTLGLIPIGAFTEPDEEELKKTTKRKRTRVYSIGSMMNLITAFTVGVFLMLPMMMFVSPALTQQTIDNVKHMEVTKIKETSSFHGKMEAGAKVYNVEDIYGAGPNQEITLQTDQGEFTGETNEYGQLGITVNTVTKGSLGWDFWIQYHLVEITIWIFLLNLLIGIINYLPFAIFDGARIFEDLTGFYADKAGLNGDKIGNRLSWTMTAIVALLLIINVLPYFQGFYL